MTTGYFAVDAATRTARGTLLPYGVKSKGTSSSNTAPITFPKGNVRIPRDPMVVGLNDEHQRFQVLGRATALEDTDEGIVAEFTFADTDEADAWLASHADGAYFSAEIDQMRRMPGDIGAGVLAGAAVTTSPAFDGTFATFSLIGEETVVDEAPEPDEDVPQTTDTATAGSDDEPAEEQDEAKEDAMGEALAPAQFSRPATPKAPALTMAGFFSAARQARRLGDLTPLKAYAEDAEKAGMFALNNVTYDDATGLANLGNIPGAWLGELWQGRRFQRRVVPLITSGTLTSTTASGWVWDVKPEVAQWTGNKTAVPSNTPTVAPRDFAAQRFAGGHDLAREYYDFNVTEVIDSYAQAMVDSYAMKSDAYALNALGATATLYTPDPATENVELLAVIDGALAVIAAQGTPTFAIVAPDVFKGIIAVPHSDALEYFSAAIGLEGGTAAGFRIVPDSRLPEGTIIVGDKAAATAWELPGSPIRVSLPDLVLGGIDEAFFGYIAVGTTYPEALVKTVLTAA